MEFWTKCAWLLLAAVHAPPAAVAFAPELARRLYGVDPNGTLGLLVVHRGVLFLAIVATALFATFDHNVRRAASVIIAISMVGFLALYALGGMPAGSLRTIAVLDAAAMAPLIFVAAIAWRS